MDSLKSSIIEQDLIAEIKKGHEEIGEIEMELYRLKVDIQHKEEELAKIWRERKDVI